MTSDYLVSVVMTCYNSAEFLSEAIRSVLHQTHSNLELIIVNDGSTDHSEEIIRSFNDGRIKYIRQDNQGQSAASNGGLRNANGRYIKFFDSDDVMNPAHLEAQLKMVGGLKGSLSSCAWGRFYNNNFESAKFNPESVWKNMSSLEWMKTALSQKYDMMPAWLWLIPIEILNVAGGMDERLILNKDFEFSMRLLRQSKRVFFAEDAKMFYRSGRSSTESQKRTKKKYESALLSTNLGCQYLLECEDSSDTRRMCANRYQEWLFRIYPQYPDLQKEILNAIYKLGGSDRKMGGGRIFSAAESLIGWRAAKRLKLALSHLGYRKLPFN